MKHIYLFLLLIATGLFTACSDETSVNNGNGPTLPEGHAMVKFSFNGIGGTARSYAYIAPDDALEECRIDSVMVYVFNNDADNDGTPDATTEPATDAVLENIAKIQVTALTDDEYSAQATFINKGPKWIVVVANFRDTASIKEGMIYSQFIEQCTPAISGLPTTPLIMSGMNYGVLNSDVPLVTTIELTRAVTRIDITIRNSETVNGTNPFKLKQVRLTNVNKKGYLMWNSDGAGAFNEPAGQRFTTEWIDVESDVLTSNVADSLWHYLYTYETLASTNNQVVLEIKGNYKGQPSEYKIPLTRDEDTNITPNVPLRNLVRNHRYLVYIDSVTYIDVDGEVIVSDWDFTERDTIPYEPEVDFGAPVATIQNEASYTINAGQLIGNLTVDTIVAPEAGYTAGDVMVIDLVSYNVRSEFKSSADWITAEEVSSYSTVNSDLVEITQQFKVTINALTEGYREGYFEFRNPIIKSNKVGYAVQQGAPIKAEATIVTGTGITIDNTAKTIAMSDYTSNGTVSFEFDENAVVEIPAEAAGWLTLAPSSYATKTQTINIARNNSYTAKNVKVIFRYPTIEDIQTEYAFTQPAAPATITINSVTGGVLDGTNINDVSRAGGTLVIQATEIFEESAYTISESWITFDSKETVTEPTGSNMRVTKYTFAIKESVETAARNATIEFSNTGNESVTLTVNQQGSIYTGTPLARFAKGNLTAVYSDSWTTLTEDNAGTATEEIYGKTFQWARNYAFNSTLGATPATSSATVPSNDETNSTWSTAAPWHTETGQVVDYWTRIFATTKDKDVCPDGWHVPTKAEYESIIPANWIAGGDWSTGQYQVIEDYAVRYKWVVATSPYMEIKMLPALANGITTENVMGSTLWSNENTETRYFPAAGDRWRTDAISEFVGEYGLYWSATSSTAKNAYDFEFNLNSVTMRSNPRSLGCSVRCIAD